MSKKAFFYWVKWVNKSVECVCDEIDGSVNIKCDVKLVNTGSLIFPFLLAYSKPNMYMAHVLLYGHSGPPASNWQRDIKVNTFNTHSLQI